MWSNVEQEQVGDMMPVLVQCENSKQCMVFSAGARAKMSVTSNSFIRYMNTHDCLDSKGRPHLVGAQPRGVSTCVATRGLEGFKRLLHVCKGHTYCRLGRA